MNLLLTFALLGTLQGPNPAHTFTRSQELAVTVLATDGEALAGATVSLCQLDKQSEESCDRVVTGRDGRAGFTAIAVNEYSITGELDGFAPTMISPLSIGGEDPIAPDQVVLMLNPVCWDC